MQAKTQKLRVIFRSYRSLLKYNPNMTNRDAWVRACEYNTKTRKDFLTYIQRNPEVKWV